MHVLVCKEDAQRLAPINKLIDIGAKDAPRQKSRGVSKR
ncbi:MAG: hypothetical protein QOH93_3532 [Chloroflexia bacterium]|nr:hypothetical protein [Chloroflexia bacterium]